ncbi:type IV toxin-antitoxin system AbiEi family antitoxin domain-containing protein [Gemmatimonadota bacterium DH-20]|uniref:Type IV toxin-antitoxin system AbiEi family antitoxin domain-containing protein n=2 Tax=Gaopeijia maritima TaxID=3119007 RepID=A0ABU9EEE9_9BACT
MSDIARRQHGLVTRPQLIDAGASAKMIRLRVKRGRLRPMHQGVFLFGSVAPPLARAMAACLACGPDAMVSHRSAAELWGLVGAPAEDRPVVVTVTGGNRRRAGVEVRRSRTLAPGERTVLDRIPITTVDRTLLDLAVDVRRRTLERAVAEALARGLTSDRRLVNFLRRHPRSPGSGKLRAVLDAGAPPRTRSEAEERFLSLVRRAGMPRPEVNVRVGPWEVDFYWPRARVVVEVDGYASHHSGRAFERDRRRDGDLIARGLQVMRVTWRQMDDEPEGVSFRLGRLLGAG